MNKKAQLYSKLLNQTVFIILVLVFAGFMFWYVRSQQDGAAVWEDFYVKEVSNMVNRAEAGQTYRVDVHRVSVIAKDNGVDFDKIFEFDNKEKKICVQLSKGRRTCHNWISDLLVSESRIDFAVGFKGDSKNVLEFKVIEDREILIDLELLEESLKDSEVNPNLDQEDFNNVA
jgi:hypothetical protein